MVAAIIPLIFAAASSIGQNQANQSATSQSLARGGSSGGKGAANNPAPDSGFDFGSFFTALASKAASSISTGGGGGSSLPQPPAPQQIIGPTNSPAGANFTPFAGQLSDIISNELGLRAPEAGTIGNSNPLEDLSSSFGLINSLTPAKTAAGGGGKRSKTVGQKRKDAKELDDQLLNAVTKQIFEGSDLSEQINEFIAGFSDNGSSSNNNKKKK